MILRVVNYDNVRLKRVIGIGAILDGVIRKTSEERRGQIESGLDQHPLFESPCVHIIAIGHAGCSLHCVVIGHDLLLSAGDGVMVLEYT
jgi:hypothetical protein